uniref:Uncharacterized protein n=1 Tax=viral metagenome TaxID=1070528 RepID=A0A6M3L2N5_9ZZZZ
MTKIKDFFFSVFCYLLVILWSIIALPFLLITAWQTILKQWGVSQEDIDTSMIEK